MSAHLHDPAWAAECCSACACAAACTFAASCCGGGWWFLGRGGGQCGCRGGHHGNRGRCCGRAARQRQRPQAAAQKDSCQYWRRAGAGDGIGGGNENLDTVVWETAEYNANYGLGAINASTAYARGFTGDGVTVSVLIRCLTQIMQTCRQSDHSL